MEIYEQIDLNDCPICGGAGCLEEENKGYYISCLDCGSHSVHVPYSSEETKLEAAKKTAMLWNTGKVLSEHSGE